MNHGEFGETMLIVLLLFFLFIFSLIVMGGCDCGAVAMARWEGGHVVHVSRNYRASILGRIYNHQLC